MSQFTLFEIFTMFLRRPIVPQLDLDLVEVRGGGAIPTQFWGRTADNSPVYIRYRDAWLEIHKGESGADDDSPGMRCVFEENIGPPLHGVILLQQVSDLTGLTVRGKRLSLPEQEWREAKRLDPIIDFSGRRTYWERATRSSLHGMTALTRRLQDEFDELDILNIVGTPVRAVESVGDCRYAGAFAIGRKKIFQQKLLAGDLQTEIEDAYVLAVSFNVSWNEHEQRQDPQQAARMMKELGRTPEQAPTSWGRFWAMLAADSEECHRLLHRFILVMDSCYGNQVEAINLETNEKLKIWCPEVWQSNDMRDWCLSTPDRYLGIINYTSQPTATRATASCRWMGIRPPMPNR